MKIAIIADDLTGACDIAAQFLQCGRPVLVHLDTNDIDIESIPVINIQTRTLGRAAYEKTSDTASALQKIAPQNYLLKIDSAFRGRPGTLVSALLDSLPVDHAHIIPAIPDIGRTTIGGKQLSGGIPIDELPYANDIHNPIKSADVRECFNSDMNIEHSHRLIVHDAVTNADIDNIIAEILAGPGPRLLVGSVGVGQALAKAMYDRQSEIENKQTAANSPVLIINGSTYAATKEQIRHAQKLHLANYVAAEEITDYNIKQDTIVSLSVKHKPREAVTILSTLAQKAIKHSKLGGLGVIGGETAFRICTDLGISKIKLIQQVSEVVQGGIIAEGRHKKLPLATKGGSVGKIDAIVKMIRYLKGAQCENRLSA